MHSSRALCRSYLLRDLNEMFGKRDIARTHYENCGAYPPAVEALKRLEYE